MRAIEVLTNAGLKHRRGTITPEMMELFERQLDQFTNDDANEGVMYWIDHNEWWPSWFELKDSIRKAGEVRQARADYELHKAKAATSTGSVQARAINDDMRFAIEVKRGTMRTAHEIDGEIAEARQALQRNPRYLALIQPVMVVNEREAVPA